METTSQRFGLQENQLTVGENVTNVYNINTEINMTHLRNVTIFFS